jgi:hypothetical protein
MYPGDYRSKEQIMQDYAANSLVEERNATPSLAQQVHPSGRRRALQITRLSSAVPSGPERGAAIDTAQAVH